MSRMMRATASSRRLTQRISPLTPRLPAAGGQRNGLSQIAIGADGDLFVERFGFGSASAIFRVDAAGHVTLTSDANPSRRRLGIGRAEPDGTVVELVREAG